MLRVAVGGGCNSDIFFILWNEDRGGRDSKKLKLRKKMIYKFLRKQNVSVLYISQETENIYKKNSRM